MRTPGVFEQPAYELGTKLYMIDSEWVYQTTEDGKQELSHKIPVIEEYEVVLIETKTYVELTKNGSQTRVERWHRLSDGKYIGPDDKSILGVRWHWLTREEAQEGYNRELDIMLKEAERDLQLANKQIEILKKLRDTINTVTFGD